MANTSRIAEIAQKNEQSILTEWMEEQKRVVGSKLNSNELKNQCSEFLRAFIDAAKTGELDDIKSSQWNNARALLTAISKNRGLQGFSPSETATFIFSIKRPLFTQIRREFENKPADLANEMWQATTLIDQLGLFSNDAYLKTREEVIIRQQADMLELSTPVVKLWEGILALPMIGTLDSSRTQVVMETLLQRIVETNSEIAIIDITGVPTVDTLVAQHLMKTVTAARLMGAECIISGIRPQIAATIVHLGVDLGDITTKATLADAFTVALSRIGRTVQKVGHQQNRYNQRDSRA